MSNFNSIRSSNFSFKQFQHSFDNDTNSLLMSTDSKWDNDSSYPDLSQLLLGKKLKDKILNQKESHSMIRNNIKDASPTSIPTEISLLSADKEINNLSENPTTTQEIQPLPSLKLPSRIRTRKLPSPMEVFNLQNYQEFDTDNLNEKLPSKYLNKKTSAFSINSMNLQQKTTQNGLNPPNHSKTHSNLSNIKSDRISPTIVNQSTDIHPSHNALDLQNTSNRFISSQAIDIPTSLSQLMTSYQQCGDMLEKLSQQYNQIKASQTEILGPQFDNETITNQLEYMNSSFISLSNQCNDISQALANSHPSLPTNPASLIDRPQNNIPPLTKPHHNKTAPNLKPIVNTPIKTNLKYNTKSVPSIITHHSTKDISLSEPVPTKPKLTLSPLPSSNPINSKPNSDDIFSSNRLNSPNVTKLDSKTCKHMIEDIMILLNVKDPTHLLSTLKSILLTLSQLIQLQPYLNTLDQLVYQTQKPKCLSLIVERFPAVTEIIHERFGKQFHPKLLNQRDTLMSKPGFRSLSCRFKI